MPDNRGDEHSQSERDYAESLGQDIRDRVHAEIDERVRARRRRPPAAALVFAVVIIAAGVLLFLDNLGV